MARSRERDRRYLPIPLVPSGAGFVANLLQRAMQGFGAEGLAPPNRSRLDDFMGNGPGIYRADARKYLQERLPAKLRKSARFGTQATISTFGALLDGSMLAASPNGPGMELAKAFWTRLWEGAGLDRLGRA